MLSMLTRRLSAAALLAACSLSSVALGQKAGTIPIVGNTGVSGQMMFLQSNGQVAILDKVENNPATRPDIDAPAYAVFYNYNNNTFQATSVRSNTFCAGGAMLGDGRWIVTGGNAAVNPGGSGSQNGQGPYYTYDGGRALRFLSPCSGGDCQWVDEDSNQMDKERWYPTLEPMRDGHVLIAGGMRVGGFISTSYWNEPTYEFYPPVGGSQFMPILNRTMPISLYPILFLMADDRVFVSARREAILWDFKTQTETALNTVPVTSRNYPASGGAAMLPMLPSNNYSQTIIFCGGNDLGSDANWGTTNGPAYQGATQKLASVSCATITPLKSKKWQTVDNLPVGRTMGQFVNLPDGTLWFAMGAKTGVAGYTTDNNSPANPVGFSLADNPSYVPYIYDPAKAAGKRWTKSGRSMVGRLYHSTATLLPDSSILMTGSNPNPDVTNDVKWPTEYRAERWYPSYYDKARPSNAGLPSAFGYGGASFTLTATSAANARNTKVVIIRTGFSTHGLSMGQRMIQLRTTVSGRKVTVYPLPANPSLFAPGTALAFVVVNGVPSMGKFITVGNGQIGEQTIGSSSTRVSRLSIPSLNGTELRIAESIVKHLRGDPVAGVWMDPDPDWTFAHMNHTVDSMVQDTFQGIKNGSITDVHGG